MKPSHDSTSPSVAPVLRLIGSWVMTLHLLHQRLVPLFARPKVAAHALLYLHALLSYIPRKNGWQIAEQARQARPYGMQRLLSRSVWDQDATRDVLRSFVCEQLHPLPRADPSMRNDPVFPVLVIDESGFPKRGHHSAGVAPQYCGVHGQVENCQVGVFLSLVNSQGHALIDRELYVPEEWCTDLPRRQAAHLPDDLRFQTKPELAVRMLHRCLDAQVPITWVVADSVYGHSPTLRAWLQEHDLPYALAVPSIEVVSVQTRTGPLLADVSTIASRALRPSDWHRLCARSGTKGECRFDWARLPVLEAGVSDGRHWLLVRRCLDDPSQLAFLLVWAPADTSLAAMVQACGARWCIEEDFQATKALGLDQYEVRSWVGWYRHITLVLLAYALLVSLCLPTPDASVHLNAPLASMQTPLRPAEAQHLLAHLMVPAPSSLPFIVAWSQFRRTHQFWATFFHRRRRQHAGNSS